MNEPIGVEYGIPEQGISREALKVLLDERAAEVFKLAEELTKKTQAAWSLAGMAMGAGAIGSLLSLAPAFEGWRNGHLVPGLIAAYICNKLVSFVVQIPYDSLLESGKAHLDERDALLREHQGLKIAASGSNPMAEAFMQEMAQTPPGTHLQPRV
jgi:hypothetical protein